MATHSSILENPLDRGAWQATVLGVAESDTPEATVRNFICHLELSLPIN